MSLKKISLPDEITQVIATIEQNGYEAYIVGGAVRDFVMGRSISDYDITTNARPEQICNMFSKVVETGIKHGTVTVLAGKYSVEVTSYRVDGEYQNHRRPMQVEFSNSLAEDLKRRDFTINALAYNPETGIVDLFGGVDDIHKKIIRTVGEPDKRFNEDALRMLRAVRFSACLGFDILPDAFASMLKNAHLMEYVSRERIKAELDKAIMGDYVEKLGDYADFMSIFLPHLDKNVGILNALSNIDKTIEIRWAKLLSKAHPDAEEFICKYKFSNAEKKKIRTLLKYSGKEISHDRVVIKNILRKTDDDLFEDVLKMKQDKAAYEIYRDIKSSREPYRISHLALGGNEVLSVAEDKTQIGQMLEYLLDRVIQNPSLNKREKLLELLEEYHV